MLCAIIYVLFSNRLHTGTTKCVSGKPGFLRYHLKPFTCVLKQHLFVDTFKNLIAQISSSRGVRTQAGVTGVPGKIFVYLGGCCPCSLLSTHGRPQHRDGS